MPYRTAIKIAQPLAFSLIVLLGMVIISNHYLPSSYAVSSATQQNNGMSATHTTGWQSYVSLVKFTGLTPGNKIDQVAINVFAASGNVRYKVYQDDGAGGAPSTLLAESNSFAATVGTTYNLLNTQATIPASGNVWVGFETDSLSLDIYYTSTVAGTRAAELHTFGTGPNPFVTGVSVASPMWAGIDIITPLSTPNSPTGLTANAISPTQINLSWTTPTNDG